MMNLLRKRNSAIARRLASGRRIKKDRAPRVIEALGRRLRSDHGELSGGAGSWGHGKSSRRESWRTERPDLQSDAAFQNAGIAERG